MIESLYILIITSLACAILGVFLVLRRLSMVSDAISHSVLLGIVIGYFITKDIGSALLIIGASLFGVLTTICIELLIKSKRVSEDASVGIIFPMFFSVAVILITRYARNVHLDTEVVLIGEIILAPFHRINFLGASLPKALVQMSFVLLINIIFVTVFFRKLKISSFDPVYAGVAGIAGTGLYYIFMALISFTAVSAFESVGAILAIAFFISPAASAYLISKDLKITLLLSAVYAIVNSCIGYFLAVKFNVSMSGMCAVVSGLTFMITMAVYPGGIITKMIRYIKNKNRFSRELLILHIDNHTGKKNALGELGYSTIREHIAWSDRKLKYVLDKLIKKGYVYRAKERGVYSLTETGKKLSNDIRKHYGLRVRENDMAKIDTGRDDYILAIYDLIEKKETATNKKIAEILGIKAASVSEMLKKLVEEGEVYTENKSILLTETGKMRARALLTKHRLWELFLVEYLGYSWKNVHEDAKALEYVTSNGLKDRLNEFLNKPKHCPHGNEIYENHPDVDKLKKLSELSKGAKCRLHKVEDDRDLLEYLVEKKINLGDEFIIKDIDNFDDSVLVSSESEDKHIAGKAAVRMMVEVI
ncbi:metal ABC transporter permease [Lachnoanaerobaculum umeaense]|uniref:Winged helix-turn-helix transcriptional regulator n=1 Tax=Lachnoanaerobaculum umeaense TaxID=617123 RepID=A0A385Q291_9FIRM|nr:metal ABC transporter permease [Lachnoanaerobaculum umeaense]AYB00336.1 winged helix-turn-helix transcriptional regulator [Lachnoanaerobaculum umeaense]PZW96038.1 DtxR family iron (metal) dependent repressor [Lachnoanaerobaculum umeaense]